MNQQKKLIATYLNLEPSTCFKCWLLANVLVNFFFILFVFIVKDMRSTCAIKCLLHLLPDSGKQHVSATEAVTKLLTFVPVSAY